MTNDKTNITLLYSIVIRKGVVGHRESHTGWRWRRRVVYGIAEVSDAGRASMKP